MEASPYGVVRPPARSYEQDLNFILQSLSKFFAPSGGILNPTVGTPTPAPPPTLEEMSAARAGMRPMGPLAPATTPSVPARPAQAQLPPAGVLPFDQDPEEAKDVNWEVVPPQQLTVTGPAPATPPARPYFDRMSQLAEGMVNPPAAPGTTGTMDKLFGWQKGTNPIDNIIGILGGATGQTPARPTLLNSILGVGSRIAAAPTTHEGIQARYMQNQRLGAEQSEGAANRRVARERTGADLFKEMAGIEAEAPHKSALTDYYKARGTLEASPLKMKAEIAKAEADIAKAAADLAKAQKGESVSPEAYVASADRLEARAESLRSSLIGTFGGASPEDKKAAEAEIARLTRMAVYLRKLAGVPAMPGGQTSGSIDVGGGWSLKPKAK
jgi:hypothetical protein